MSTRKFRPSNGVSYGLVYTVTAQDASDGTITFDFQQTRYFLAAAIQVVSALNAVVDLADVVITYPSEGKVTVANGSTFLLTAGQKISLIAQRATSVLV